MTTTVEIPDDVARAVQRRAAEGGRDVAAEVVELVRKGLAVSEAAEPHVTPIPPVISTDPTTGLPLIQGAPNAPISRMSPEAFQAMCEHILMEEDLERAGIPSRR